MDNYLPIVYLSILLILLGVAAVSIFRQVLKTRGVETKFSRLQNQLKNEKGTAQDYYELGSLYLDKKLFVQSVNLFQKALKAGETDPENTALIYNSLGYAYFAQEQYDIAIRNYKEAIRLNPSYVVGFNNLGHAYEQKKLTAQALEAYEETLKLEPDNQIAKRRAEALRKRLVIPASTT